MDPGGGSGHRPLICWSPSGTSFHVFDQGRFSKEVLPKYFNTTNMASFIRQLNMYGFRKVVHIEQGGLLKPERDDTEFQHPFFVRGQEHLLENIKRKVTNVCICIQPCGSLHHDYISNCVIIENEALWREVASLRQKHAQQQKVVNKLIQFLVSLVQTTGSWESRGRCNPLMLNDSSSAHSMPKYSRQFSLEHMQPAASLFSPDSPVTSGPIISDITEVTTPTAEEVREPIGQRQRGAVQSDVEVCPVLECGATPVDTPLSPTTFINSILQDTETQPTPNTSTANPAPAIVVMNPASTGPLPPSPASQSPASNPAQIQTTPIHLNRNVRPSLVSTDPASLPLQNILNTQTFTFDTSPLIESQFAMSSGDFDLDSLDTLLSEGVLRGCDESSNTRNTVTGPAENKQSQEERKNKPSAPDL
ncbi:hypothetical protein INR49_007126, partial [Caranx melampygus]